PTADAFTKTHNNEYTNLKSSLWKKILEATFFDRKTFAREIELQTFGKVKEVMHKLMKKNLLS
ncbi:MAG: hypothetical protein ACLTVB_05305, partial [Sutterella sp.]